MMHRITYKLASISLLLFSLTIFSQQDAQYTQYMYNMNVLNPAYAGSKEGTLSASILGRKQWMGIPGSPQTAVLSVHSPITNRMGLGVSILADKIGPINEQFLFADYSYTIPVGRFDYLAFGVKTGISLVNAKLSDLDLNDYSDENFLSNINNLQPNFGFGAFYYGDNYYAGISIPNLLQTSYLEKGDGFEATINKRNHIFLTGGYVFDMSYYWKFKPSIMTKVANGAPLSIDLSANFFYDGKYEVGTSYRFGDSVSLLLNARVSENLRIGYSYDFTTTELNQFNSGSHELIILFDLKTSYEIISPRYF